MVSLLGDVVSAVATVRSLSKKRLSQRLMNALVPPTRYKANLPLVVDVVEYLSTPDIEIYWGSSTSPDAMGNFSPPIVPILESVISAIVDSTPVSSYSASPY